MSVHRFFGIALGLAWLISWAGAEEPLWTLEMEFTHREREFPSVDCAKFSADGKYVEVHVSVPDETNGPTGTGYYRYNILTGKADGKRVDSISAYSAQSRIPESLQGDTVLSTQVSFHKRIVLAHIEGAFKLFGPDEKPLCAIPAEPTDQAWFAEHDETVVVTYAKGMRFHSVSTGAVALEVEVGYRPEFVHLSNAGAYVSCGQFRGLTDSNGITDLIARHSGKRLGTFTGRIAAFAPDDSYAFINLKQQQKSALDIRKLPSGESVTQLEGGHLLNIGKKLDLVWYAFELKERYGIAAWDLRKNRSAWTAYFPQDAFSRFHPAMWQERVICISDADGRPRLVDAATSRLLFGFPELTTRPEWKHLDPKRMFGSFDRESMRWLGYWRTDPSTLQVMVWKPTRPLK